MKHVFTSLFISISIVLFLSSCFSDMKKGLEGRELEFHSYLALGDEYTAGFMNNGLYEQGQENSFPNIMAQKLNEVGDVAFVQPIIDGNGTGYLAIESVIIPPCDQANSKVIFQENDSLLNWQLTIQYDDFYRNIGLPKLRVSHLKNKEDSYSNPYYQLIKDATNTGKISYLDAIEKMPVEFFTLWIGMNDVLEYAVSGGNDSLFHLTQADTFAQNFGLILSKIMEKNLQVSGVVANVPDITELPFFSTVPHEYFSRKPCNSIGQPIYITTDQGVRQATSDDKILLSADTLLGINDWGILMEKPIPDHLVLDNVEVQNVQRHIIRYNEKIRLEVDRFNEIMGGERLAFLDMWSEFSRIHQEGKSINGLTLSGDYLSGGLYSLDGLFPTPRGYAYISNLFINRLNVSFGYAIPNVDVTDYKGVEFP